MYNYLKKAMDEYNDATRMFNYASSPEEIDVSIMLMDAANIKIKALKRIPNYGDELQPISEVY